MEGADKLIKGARHICSRPFNKTDKFGFHFVRKHDVTYHMVVGVVWKYRQRVILLKRFQITVELIKEKMEKTEYKHPNDTGLFTMRNAQCPALCVLFVVSLSNHE